MSDPAPSDPVPSDPASNETPPRDLPPLGIARLLATGLGSGLSPVAPGTTGSIAAVLIVLVLDRTTSFPWWGPLALALGGAVVQIALGKWIARAYPGGDPGEVVLDEWVGQWIALGGVWRLELGWGGIVAAFALFRLFDITKGPGVRQAERLPGAWGILMDDVVAGLYAGALLWAGAALLAG